MGFNGQCMKICISSPILETVIVEADFLPFEECDHFSELINIPGLCRENGKKRYQGRAIMRKDSIENDWYTASFCSFQ